MGLAFCIWKTVESTYLYNWSCRAKLGGWYSKGTLEDNVTIGPLFLELLLLLGLLLVLLVVVGLVVLVLVVLVVVSN